MPHRTRRPRLAEIGLTAGILFAAAVIWRMHRPFYFPLDDAYITIHNAQALLAGSDTAYGVSPLVGATSPVHLALVAAFTAVLPPVLASYLVCVLGCLLYGVALLRLAHQHRLDRLGTGALLVIGACAGFTSYQVVNGLETVWAMAAVAWGLVLAPTPNRWIPLLCGTLPFIRPELGIFSVLLLGRQIYLRRDAKHALIDLLIAAAAATPWLAWSYLSTGTLLPNSADAKLAFFAETSQPFIKKLGTLVHAMVDGIAWMLLPLLFIRRSSLSWVLLGFAAAFLGGFTLLFPGGLYQNFFRYQCVLLPVALWALCRLQTRPGVGRIIAISFALWSAYTLPIALRRAEEGRTLVQDNIAAARWIDAFAEPGTPVLVHDAGVIAVETSRIKPIDVVGLKRPASIALHRAYTLPTGGADRWRAVDAIARESGAAYAIILEEPFWRGLADDLLRAGWTLVPLRRSTIPDGYTVFRLQAPGTAQGTIGSG